MNLRQTFTSVAILLLALLAPGRALAAGGNYVFDGGTPTEQRQVTSALDVSAFDWGIVPARITVHIGRGIDSEATRGEIWLDADLLDAGQFSWGTVQHEYAHQVDFFLLGDAARSALTRTLGAATWWADGVHGHGAIGAERFASTVAWAYWPNRGNSMRPTGKGDESAALPPAQFRALLSRLLDLPAPRLLAFHR